MSDINKERQTAVREAWKNERAQVRDGKGSRDWSQIEQKQIIAKGRANGYEGHHMKSVKEYPQYAGDSQNIQFLNRSEHVNGAHKGNTQNATNGYFDYKTGSMHSFGNSYPQTPQLQALSTPLTHRQQNIAIKSEQACKQAAIQAKSEIQQADIKFASKNALSQEGNNTTTPVNQDTNKGIENYKNLKSINQTTDSSQLKNQGITNYQNKLNNQNINNIKNGSNSVQSNTNGQNR
jgi:hypothetical protein